MASRLRRTVLSLDPTLPLFPDSPDPQKSLGSLLGSALRMLRGRLAPEAFARKEQGKRLSGHAGLGVRRARVLALSSAVLRSLVTTAPWKGRVGPAFLKPCCSQMLEILRVECPEPWGTRSQWACWRSRARGCTPRLGARQGTALGSLCSLPIPAELWFLFSSGDLGFWGTSIPLSPIPTILSHLPPLLSPGPVLG